MNETSEPIGFYNFGVSYLDVARIAAGNADKLMFSDPIEFLIAHGLELIFKADLRRTRSLETVRKKFGHNLKKMYNALSTQFKNEYVKNDELMRLVDYLSVGHSGPNWRNRYLVTGTRSNVLPINKMLEILAGFHTNNRKWLTNHFSRQAV